MKRSSTPLERRAGDDHDAIVIGAGHNGLITAAYLARAGLSVLLVEARATVGGTAATEEFAGAKVNICNCDHVSFRAMPIAEELGLAAHGLRYLDIDAGHHISWADGVSWAQHHDVEATVESIARVQPEEVEGYLRFTKAAIPAIRMTLDAATRPPTRTSLTRHALLQRLHGAPTLLRWSRRSAADVLRSYFTRDALPGAATVGGPMVWGISPELPGTGLGALGLAMKHVVRVGRPVGGSGAMPEAVLASFLAAGGTLRTSGKVTAIDCEGEVVRGVTLADGSQPRARIVVSACDPRRTFVEWLADPPPAAAGMVARWRAMQHHEGYESKIDAVLSEPPRFRQLAGHPDEADALIPTGVVAPTLAGMDAAAAGLTRGDAPTDPVFLVNVPTAVDPSMAPAGRHVFSLEVLLTPYRIAGGWPNSPEPQRWLERFATLAQPGFLDTVVDWRVMTPDRYETDFNLPYGHATSFAGGPLAALRSRQPELTRYETAVPGLFLTGAATFPGAGVWGASGRNCALTVLKTTG